MKKMMSKKVLGVIALALVCVMAGTVLGMNRPAAQAETVVLTSPFTAAIAQVRDSVVGVNNYQIVNNYNNGYGNGGYGNGGSYGFPWDYFFGYGNGGYGNGYGNGGSFQQPEAREEKYGSGSGVVIENEYVLTGQIERELKSSIRVPCTSCRYCTEVCPKDIAIPNYFGLLNLFAVTGKKTNMYYERYSMNHGKASECMKCGRCEKNCPQHIPIRELLEEFAALYET